MERTSDIGPRELLMLGLSVYVLAAFAAEAVLPLSPGTRQVLLYADTGICAIFLADFFAGLARAKDRRAFLRRGWIDLVSSIPLLGFVRVGQAARVVRILRVVRSARSAHRLGAYLLRQRARAALSTALLITILLMVFGSIAVLELEAGRADGNIRTAPDALWWAMTTITTVGYGDLYPVSVEGRMVAALLMTAGVACFGIFTASAASWFMAPARESRDELARVHHQLEAVLQALAALHAGQVPPHAPAPRGACLQTSE